MTKAYSLVSLLSVMLSCSLNVNGQKRTPCELKEKTILEGHTLLNSELGLKLTFPPDFVPVEADQERSFIQALAQGDESLHIPSELSDLDFLTTLAMLNRPMSDEYFNLYVQKNLLMAFGEDVYQDLLIRSIESKDNLVVLTDAQDHKRQSCKGSQGLWWYFVEWKDLNKEDEHTYVFYKNYNAHLLLILAVYNVSSEMTHEDVIERIQINEWYDDLKLKRRKGDCPAY